MQLDEIISRARKKPLWHPGEHTLAVTHGRETIVRMIPHREPMLLVDRIVAVDLEQQAMRAVRRIDPADPVLRGHFPDHPVYPGALLVEAMGQASLCLYHLLRAGRVAVHDDDRPLPVRLLRIHQTLFLAEVAPGAEVELLARQLEDDSFTVTCAAQALVDGRVCAVAAMDVFLVDEEEG